MQNLYAFCLKRCRDLRSPWRVCAISTSTLTLVQANAAPPEKGWGSESQFRLQVNSRLANSISCSVVMQNDASNHDCPTCPSIVESSEKVIPVEKPKRFPKSWLKFENPQLCLLIVLIWRQYGHFPASRQDRASVLNPAPGSHAKTYETDQTRKHQKPKTEVLVWFSLLWYNRDKVCVRFFKACSLVEQIKRKPLWYFIRHRQSHGNDVIVLTKHKPLSNIYKSAHPHPCPALPFCSPGSATVPMGPTPKASLGWSS